MKYLKLFESFDVVMPKEINSIVSEWGLTIDDIEELFLEFSDMGYDIRIMPYSKLSMSGRSINQKKLMVDINGLTENESYSPEISEMLRQIIRRSNKLGLYTIDSPNRIKYGSDDRAFLVKFIFNKR